MSHQEPSHQEPLFEVYRPRSISKIKADRQALRDSEAAESARIILQGVEDPEFTFPDGLDADHLDQPDAHRQARGGLYTESNSKSNKNASAQTQHAQFSLTRQLFSPGAQFVYALLIITGLSGLIGLAATIESPMLVLISGIASPMLLPICIWKWIRWLDSSPYYYRLLTSLGEDARNLLGYRLLWKRST